MSINYYIVSIYLFAHCHLVLAWSSINQTNEKKKEELGKRIDTPNQMSSAKNSWQKTEQLYLDKKKKKLLLNVDLYILGLKLNESILFGLNFAKRYCMRVCRVLCG